MAVLSTLQRLNNKLYFYRADQLREHGKFAPEGGSKYIAGYKGNGINRDASGKLTEHWARDAQGKIRYDQIKEVKSPVSQTATSSVQPIKEGSTPKDVEDRIIHAFTQDAQSVSKPVAIFTAGGNGSGKSTSIEESGVLNSFGNEGHVVIDPDGVKVAMPAYQELMNSGVKEAARITHEESSRIANKILDTAITNHNHILVDKTLENADKASVLLDRLKQNGYEVHMVGVSTHPHIAEARSIVRGERSGRYIPHEVLQHVHEKVNSQWDRWSHDSRLASFRHFENSDPKPMQTTFSRNGESRVHNQALWDTVRNNYGVKGGA